MNFPPTRMKIDFTEFEQPVDALTLSDWTRNHDLDVSPEDASHAGLSSEQADSEYELTDVDVNFQFAPMRKLEFSAASVLADVRANNSLRSIRVRSKFLTPSEIYELASPVIRDWELHSFEETTDSEDVEAPDKKIDALTELKTWRDVQSDLLPSFLAQSDPNPFPGVWFFRLVVNPSPENDSLYGLSIQTFWRDAEFDDKHVDRTFWDRADAIINLANDQSSDESISRVADSLLYAAARYNAFDYWRFHHNEQEFTESRDEAISDCMNRFQKMLEDNFDDHVARFSEANNGE